MSIPSVLRAVHTRGAQAPYRPALLVVEPSGTLQFSAGDLLSGMLAWAQGLHRLRPAGSPPGASVAVLVAPKGFAAYACLLGAMRAGMAGCILPGPTVKQDPRTYWETHRAVLARIAPAVVVAPAELADMLHAVLPPGTKVIDAAAPPAAGEEPLPDLDEVDNDHAAAILQHSSGTTGLKKGVVLTYGQIREQARSYAHALGMRSDDKVASWLPLYHDMGLVTALLLPLSLGSIVVCMDPFDWLANPASILQAITRYRASFCWLPNFAFAHLAKVAADEGPFDLSSMRAFIDCSEPCRADTLDAFVAAFAPHGLRPGAIATCYAMAETVFAVTQSRLGKAPAYLSVDREAMSVHAVAVPVEAGAAGAVRLVSCGRPVEGTSLRIAAAPGPDPSASDEPVRFLPTTSAPSAGLPVGEILVASGSAFAGYHRNPEASAAALDGGWYRTGDLGFVHEGELYVSGRTKDLIIVNGRNFYAHDIEAAAHAAADVKPGRAAAFGIAREAAGSEGAVVVVESHVAAGQAAETVARSVRDAVSQALGLALHDVVVRPPGALVKTTSGKVSREDNRRMYAEGAMA